MKKHLLTLVLILICSALCAQDLIVTDNKDSMNCQILEIRDGMIHFDMVKDGKKDRVALPMYRVLSTTYDYYSTAETDAKVYNVSKKQRDYARFRVAAAGGYSYRIPAVDSEIPREFAKSLKNGYNYGVEFNYYFNRFLGIGINYYASRFHAEWFGYSQKVRLQQIIPTFDVRVLDKQKRGAFVAGIGLGYVDCKYREFEDNRHVETVKGATLGMLWHVGYEIPISQMMAIYVQASLNGGVVTRFTITDEITGKTYTESVEELEQGEGLGKINLSIGVRFAK